MKTSNVLKVGVTGGIGSGKSLVCRVFETLGVPMYDADARAKWLMAHDPTLKQALVNLFGPETYLGDGSLNRAHLRKVAFQSKEATEALNGIVHPAVGLDTKQWLKAQEGAPYVVKEAALMYESNTHLMMDVVVNVAAPESIRVERVLARDAQRSKSQLDEILKQQLSEEKRAELADFTIDNSGELPLLQQVLFLNQTFRDIDFQRYYGIQRRSVD